MAAGVRQRHGRACRRKSGCSCPYEAFVYSKRDGKKLRKTFPTHAAAVAWRNDAATAVRRKLLRAPTSLTVRDAGEALVRGAREGLIRPHSGDPYKPATVRAYETALQLRIYPQFGSRRLTEPEQIDFQDFVDRLVADGLNASTIGTTMLPLRAIYRRALKRGEVAVNPLSGLEMPAVRGGRDRIAPPQECAKLLAALPAADRTLWATAMYAGLRRGELLALRIEDVDLAAGLIHVRWGWDAVKGQIPTKNRKHRKVPIAAALRDYLEEHLRGLAWRDGLVFGVTAEKPFTDNVMKEHADKAWAKAELQRFTLHEFRHTYASLMIAAGVNAKALSTYLGHATIAFTLDRYGHLMPGNEDEAATMLDAYLARTAEEEQVRASLAPVAL
ncbi:MAG TPA: tyrosine-type recombinase/integrase [Solirubrobacteraceae bacterium]|jgi:integrase